MFFKEKEYSDINEIRRSILLVIFFILGFILYPLLIFRELRLNPEVIFESYWFIPVGLTLISFFFYVKAKKALSKIDGYIFSIVCICLMQFSYIQRGGVNIVTSCWIPMFILFLAIVLDKRDFFISLIVLAASTYMTHLYTFDIPVVFDSFKKEVIFNYISISIAISSLVILIVVVYGVGLLKDNIKKKVEFLNYKKLLLSIIYHDVSNNLQRIVFALPEPGEEGKIDPKNIRSSANNIMSIVDNVRSYDRIELQKEIHDTKYENLKLCIEKAVDKLDMEDKEREVTFEIDIDKEKQCLVHRTAFINVVLLNLFGICRKYGREDSNVKVFDDKLGFCIQVKSDAAEQVIRDWDFDFKKILHIDRKINGANILALSSTESIVDSWGGELLLSNRGEILTISVRLPTM